MQLPLRLRDPHEQILVLNRDPTRERLHRRLKIRFDEDVSRAVNQRGRCSVQDVQPAVK